ncbi:TetR/AcrR family transcriptional regulator [Paenibacillus humicola]|uniref:TetR/AcrR family transcriptional regulator n=1 Tax=Paenibacillus humicola TaxID=3110540 RepID=UPI00237B34A3|nr:TetR/AcrR family transcriptional regulator [Paenibacillus humicola]
MNGFEKRAQEIKERIIATTLEMLKTTGPKRIRIADISQAAGVSQVTIYNYFGSKEALIRDTVKMFAEKTFRDFEAYMNEKHSFKEKLAHILVLEKESYTQFPPSLFKELLSSDPELASYIDEQYKQHTIPLSLRIFQEGKDSGEISDEVSAENVLALMHIYMSQYETILEMAQQSGDMEKFFGGMVHMFFYGLCGKP